MDETKYERIENEKKRLNRLILKADAKVKKAVKSLIENIAFMSITLQDLQDQINANGVVSEYQNGENQWGTKKSPEVEIYNSMLKNHMVAMRQLTDLIPKTSTKKDDDGFDGFVMNK